MHPKTHLHDFENVLIHQCDRLGLITHSFIFVNYNVQFVLENIGCNF
jgi:hypothetical protein